MRRDDLLMGCYNIYYQYCKRNGRRIDEGAAGFRGGRTDMVRAVSFEIVCYSPFSQGSFLADFVERVVLIQYY